MDYPQLYEVKGGWHARGDGWSVFGRTREEAIKRYEEAERRHREIDARPLFYEWRPRSAQL